MLTCSAPPGLHSELLLRLPFLYLTVSILLCLLCQLCQLGSVVIKYNSTLSCAWFEYSSTTGCVYVRIIFFYKSV